MAIRHKRKNSTGYTWQTADLVEGQLGLNIADGTLHFKKSNGDYVALSQGGGGLTDIVQDTTPQLGGNLDVNGKSIVSVSNGNIAIAPNGTGIVTATNAVQLQAQGELRLSDSDSSNYVGFKSPATVSANKVWTLPATDGTNGQVLSTNGSGTLSWATAGGSSWKIALVTGATSFYTGTKYINWTTEDYNPDGLITISNGTFTLGTAGTYIIQWITNNSMADPNSWVLYNQTGSATLKSYSVNAIGGGTTNAVIGGYTYIDTITASRTYRWQCPNTSQSSIGGTPQMLIIKIS